MAEHFDNQDAEISARNATNQRVYNVMNRLAKWRSVFASWQLGTRLKTDGEYRAVADHRELSMFLRAELTALLYVLIKKGVITEEQWHTALIDAAGELNKTFEQRFPGFQVHDHGVNMDAPIALATMQQLGFPE